MHVFYDGSEEEGRANFKPFFDLSKLAFRLSHLTLHISSTPIPLIEPIADHTKEIPYEELNASQVCDDSHTFSDLTSYWLARHLQNARLDHGQGRLIKDLTNTILTQSGARSISVFQVGCRQFKRNLTCRHLWMFFPLRKIQSIPNIGSTCAFQRQQWSFAHDLEKQYIGES